MTGVRMKELIRTDHFVHRKSIRQIAKERHLARPTIRAALRDASPTVYTRGKPPHRPVTGPYVAIIEQILHDDQSRPPKQRHTSRRIYERLRDEYQFPGVESTVRRCVSQLRPKVPKVYLPLQFDPGVDAQVDWGTAIAILAGQQVTAHLFCCKLRASGACFVAAFPFERQEAFFEGHLRAFAFFGGVPRRLTYDNLKTAVQRILTGQKRGEQETFIAFRSHHLFESRFCTPGLEGAHEKGGVENLVGYARRKFLVPLPEVASFAELNAFLLQCCLADLQRTLPGRDTTIAADLAQERLQLLPLPAHAYECCRQLPVRADGYGRVAFETNHYSVPAEHAHLPLTLKAFVDHVEVVSRDKVLARHPRLLGRHQEVLDPLHYLPLLARRPGALEHARPIRQWQLPEVYDRYLARLQAHLPDGRGNKEYIRVLQLHRDFPPDAIEVAVELALEYRAYGYDALKSLLLQLTAATATPPRLDLSQREVLAAVKVGDFRAGQYDQLLAGGAR